MLFSRLYFSSEQAVDIDDLPEVNEMLCGVLFTSCLIDIVPQLKIQLIRQGPIFMVFCKAQPGSSLLLIYKELFSTFP